MRVSQIQNLAWLGNVLVFGGLLWVGWQFWEMKRQKPAPAPSWEKVKGGEDPNAKRWPGEISAFSHISSLNISGRIPPPPPPPEKAPPPDPVREFKASIAFLSSWDAPGRPEASTARVKFQQKEMSIKPGQTLGGFQLREITVETRADGARTGKLIFIHPTTGVDVPIEQTAPTVPPLTTAGNEPFKPGPESAADVFKGGKIPREGPLPETTYRGSNGEWTIPEAEQLWLEAFGESDVLKKLATKPDVDGLRIMSSPEERTPLGASHGIVVGDVIRSINGVAVTSKEDIMLFLRGPGKGAERYEVVVSTDGKLRTIVYRVPRRK